MPDNIENAPADAGTADSQSPEGAAAAGTESGADELTLARRRQAGADAARDRAIAERDALAAELAAERAAKAAKKPEDPATVDIEAVKRELRAEFEAELANKTKAQEAKFLDAQFPEARKRYPEVTDPVKLTELETLFGEPAKPVGNNQSRQSGGTKSIDDMSIAELRASLDSQLGGVLDRS